MGIFYQCVGCGLIVRTEKSFIRAFCLSMVGMKQVQFGLLISSISNFFASVAHGVALLSCVQPLCLMGFDYE